MRDAALKPGWQVWRFDQIAVNVNNRIDDPAEAGVEHYVGLEHLDTDSLKIRRWGVPTDVEATKLYFRKGDIIFGRRRAYQRKLAVADFDGICSAHAMVLRAKPDVVLPEFLPFFMQSDLFMNRAVEISVGSLSPTINWKTLAAQNFALPPQEEQRRIADLFWEIEQVVQRLQDAELVARTLLRSQSEQHFSEALVRYPDCVRSIEQVAIAITKGESPGWQGHKYQESAVRFITSENVLHGSLSFEPQKFIPVEFSDKLSRSKLMAGDVLINIVGGSIGRLCIVPTDIGDANINQAVALVRLSTDKLEPEYLHSYLLTPTYNHRLSSRSVDDYKPNLSLASVRAFGVPVPPLRVQWKHIEVVNQIENAISSLNRRHTSTMKMKRNMSTILNKLAYPE